MATSEGVRRMTYHERFSLMRQNTGRPHIIIHVVTYPLGKLPTEEWMKERVRVLQERLPMLHPRLVDDKTNHPGYVKGDPYDPEDIVRGVDHYRGTAMDAYKSEMERFPWDQKDGRAMWCVNLAENPTLQKGYLILSLNHLIVDGRGSTRLLKALTDEDISWVQKEDWATPTRADDTIPTSPTLRFLVPIVFRELLLPRFPAWVQRPFTQSDPWPGACKSPLDVHWDIDLMSFSPSDVARIKAAGKANGVKTLHPILKLAYLAAMWRIYGHGSPLLLAASTARDERKPELGHAAITHNYVSSTDLHVTLAGGDGFWARTREVAEKVTSEEGIAEGRMTMGLLAHVPDPDVDPNAPGFDPQLPTGWEKYFNLRASSPNPYRDSCGLSNLGLIQLPPGAEDAWWGQTASPFSSVYQVNVIGHEKGLRVASAWREGAATDKARTMEVHAVFKKLLERLNEEKGADVTLDEITR